MQDEQNLKAVSLSGLSTGGGSSKRARPGSYLEYTKHADIPHALQTQYTCLGAQTHTNVQWPFTQIKQIQPLASLILTGDWHNNFWASACPRKIQSNSGMHHYVFVTLCKDTSLQRGRFCARSLASYILRSIWWSPPVLWMRFKDGLASICILIQLRHSLLHTSTHSFQIWPIIDQIHHGQLCLWWYSQ